MISAEEDDAPLPMVFEANTEKAYPEHEEGQLTVIGDAAPVAVIPGGLEVTV